jgi:hypothetical protein
MWLQLKFEFILICNKAEIDKKFLFLVTAAILNGGRGWRTQYWKGTTPAKFALILFSGFRGEDLNVIFYQNMPNLHNLYKSGERKIPLKNSDYM